MTLNPIYVSTVDKQAPVCVQGYTMVQYPHTLTLCDIKNQMLSRCFPLHGIIYNVLLP